MSQHSMRPFGIAAVFVVLLTTCGNSATGPSAVEVDGLRISFVVEPTVLEPLQSAMARLTITNTRNDTATLVSSCSTIAWLEAYRNGEPVSLDGTRFGCFTVITTFEIAAGDSLVREFDISAAINEQPAPEGPYELRTDFRVADMPDLEAHFIVQ